MARALRRTQSRYRGSRGPNKAVILILVLLAAGALAAAGWFLLHGREGSGPEPDPAPAQTTPAPTQPEQTVQPEPEPSLPSAPESVRGIYITGPVAGDPYMDTLLELVEKTELNAVVIDVKNDEGKVTYRPDTGTVLELGAFTRYIPDLPGLVERLKEQGIYTIARIAAFKDPVLADMRPELALRYQDGASVSESGGAAWVNPYEPEVWAYLEEIALGAAEAGFDEVQFDYVRFPTARSMDQVDFGASSEGLTRSDAIAGFLERVTDSLHHRGVRVSADIFGTVITSQTDAELIGQDYVRLAELVDYVCPMIYPSHYASGSFGLELPDREPYATVYGALIKSGAALGAEHTGVRPWLQAFTATWVNGHLDYGGEELRAQIQAVYDAGYTDWLLWNAKNTYTSDGLLEAD